MNTNRNRRCKSVTIIHQQSYRCEGYRGHDSAHWAKDVWWPNRAGLPESAQPKMGVALVVGLLIGMAALTALVLWLILRH